MLAPIRRPSELGALIAAVRRQKGWSQADLAEKLGVSRIWVGQIERGKVSMRFDLVLRALNELEIGLLASIGTMSENQPPPLAEPKRPLIDIDDVADTGLERPSRPSSRKPRS